jgi:ESCRT-II complex subunit VPS22
MRKGAGISALSRHTATASSYASLSSSLSASQLSALETQLASFRESLLAFAAAHRADIRKDPAFRHQFQKMCAALGIDPLAGGNGRPAWWAESLGLGEWAAQLALQVVDVCVSTRDANGGVIEMGELIARVEAMRRGSSQPSLPSQPSPSSPSPSAPTPAPSALLRPFKRATAAEDAITPDDVRRALDLLAPLRAGYSIHTAGGATFVRSVPRELDTDQSMLLVLAADSAPRGRLDAFAVAKAAGWSGARARTALEDAVMREGMGWVDEDGSVWLLAAVEFAD